MLKKKVLLISTTNLFNNPRLVKELRLLSSLNFDISSIIFNVGYGDQKSIEIEKTLPEVNFIRLSALRESFPIWLLHSIVNKVAILISSFYTKSIYINAIAHSKRTLLINRVLKKLLKKDLVIAHTLGSLYPAYQFAKKTNTKFAFDMEDYHPGELIVNHPIIEKKRREFLLKTIIPKTTYTTYASPLYIKYTNKLLNRKPNNQHLIRNSFPENEFILKKNNSEKIQLIWYSLTISTGRGLEFILPIIQKYPNQFHLTLIGNLNTNFDNKYNITSSTNISYLGHLSQQDLHKELCQADIGLTLEQKSTDLNRDLCLTNKIISYCQAGLYILATPTKAQKDLINTNSQIGTISENLEESIQIIIEKITEIRKNKENRFINGKAFSWDSEKERFKLLLLENL